MGRGDNRRTLKMRRRRGQRYKKEQQRKLQAAIPLPSDKNTPLAAKAAKSNSTKRVAIKRSGQRQTTAAVTQAD